MLAPKLLFNLVFLGDGGSGRYLAYFRILHMDDRFRGQPPFNTSNGWRVSSAAFPELEVDNHTIILQGRERDNDNRVDYVVFHADSDREARDKLQAAIVALEDWATNCPCFSSISSIGAISPEVHASLLEAEMNAAEVLEEDEETRAPIYFDEFNPPKIALG